MQPKNVPQRHCGHVLVRAHERDVAVPVALQTAVVTRTGTGRGSKPTECFGACAAALKRRDNVGKGECRKPSDTAQSGVVLIGSLHESGRRFQFPAVVYHK